MDARAEALLRTFVEIAYDGSGGQLEPEDLETVFKDCWATHPEETAGLQPPTRDQIEYCTSWGGCYLEDALELLRGAVHSPNVEVPSPSPAPTAPAPPPPPPPPPRAAPAAERSPTPSAADRRAAVDEACAYLTKIVDEDHGGQIDVEDLARLLELIRQGMAPFLRVPDAETLEAASSWGGVYSRDAADLLRAGAA